MDKSIRRTSCFLVWVLTISVGLAKSPNELAIGAQSGDRSGSTKQHSDRFFEMKIRPLLAKRCYQCHAETRAEGGLRLDSGDAIQSGGESGPVLVPRDLSASLLVSAIRYDSLEMPPDAPLSRVEQELIERWVADGAKWSAEFQHASLSAPDRPAEPWWASQALAPSLDAISLDRAPSRIDAYVDQTLRAMNMHRAPPVDRARLIRRLSFDLLGLPPTPQQIDAFASDTRPDAYRRLVDRMMADPAYGERMARLWLDLVRFAESDGWRQDAFRPQAYRYRQWVVDAFNEAMTYDRFVAMQLAGDELAPHDPDGQVAVGYLRLGIFEFNQRDAEGQWRDIVDEITDVTADVFLATGMACAKCHDHKFDPISRRDYFRLRSAFEPVLFVDKLPDFDSKSVPLEEVRRLRAELDRIEADAIERLRSAQLKKFTNELQSVFRKSAGEKDSYEQQLSYLIGRQMSDEGASDAKIKGKIGKDAAKRRDQVVARLRELGIEPYPKASVLTVRDAPGPIRPTRIPGDSDGPSCRPGVPAVFGGGELAVRRPNAASDSTGRRTALADWITSPDNPIAARVLANRLWQLHFGSGLVLSANDFGALGSRPSHPKLLDYLAGRLLETGWNIQAVQKEIVRSDCYRQSSVHPQSTRYRRIDAPNRWLWRYPLRRLDAEQYRDALLDVTGELDRVYGGPSIAESKGADTPKRRTIYLQRKRNSIDPMLQLMDAAPGLVSVAKRDETVTAPQALMMMNSPRVHRFAKALASRVNREVGLEDSKRFVRRAHRIVIGTEVDGRLLDVLCQLCDEHPDGRSDVCHVLLNSNAFLFIE